MLKRLLLTALCFSGSVAVSKAQCSVSSYTTPTSSIVFQAKPESFYKYVGDNNNGDYSRGFVEIMGGLITVFRPNSTSKDWMLQIAVLSSSSKYDLVPRAVLFTFTDGTELQLDADTYKEAKGVHSCTFNVTEDERQQLRKPLREVAVIDTRKPSGDGFESYVATTTYGLYPKLFAEQAACLDRSR